MMEMIKGKSVRDHFYMVSEYREAVAQCLIDLLKLIEQKKITDNIGRQILEKFMENPYDFDVTKYVQENKLESISDILELELFCKESLEENPKAVEDFKKGERGALNFIIGAVMVKSKGKATPKEVMEIILGKLQK